MAILGELNITLQQILKYQDEPVFYTGCYFTVFGAIGLYTHPQLEYTVKFWKMHLFTPEYLYLFYVLCKGKRPTAMVNNTTQSSSLCHGNGSNDKSAKTLC